MKRAGEILILSGPPGSGKTTVARKIASGKGAPTAHLHADDFWSCIRHGAIPPFLPAAARQNAVVMEALASCANAYAGGGYFVVLDGIVGPWFIGSFSAVPVPLHYIVLRPALEEAIQRCRQRAGETLTDPAVIADLYRQLGDIGRWEAHVLDIAGRSPDQVADAVAAAISDRTHLLR